MKPIDESSTLVPAIPSQIRISRVHLRTRNLPQALDFYTRALGFKIIDQGESSISLSTTGQGPALIVFTEDSTATLPTRLTTGLYHFALRYPTRRDLAEALLRLAEAEYGIDGASDHIVSEAIYLRDPDQNGVELYVDRPRNRWVWRGGQVQMSTEALDLNNLLTSADGHEDLSKLSPLIDIGHIHLHVADLKEAEHFYHDFLGLAVTQRSYPGALFFSAGGYHHHVATNTWAGKTKPSEKCVGLISYRLEFPEMDFPLELRRRATLAGYASEDSESSGTGLAKFQDPAGRWLEVASDWTGLLHNGSGGSLL
jgi:catechol 2,3-dioxygenase